jgi:hypothetical protein
MQQQDAISTGSTTSSASSPAADQVREVARAGAAQVKDIGQTAKERARLEIDARRERIAGEVEKLAGALEKQGGESETAGPVIGLAASAARRLSSALRERSAEDLLQGVIRSPVAVLAGSVALGFLSVRLFKA